MVSLMIDVPLAAKPQGSKKAFVRNGRVNLVESSNNLKKLRAQFSTLIHETAYADKWVRAEKDTPVEVSITFTVTKPKSVNRAHLTVKPDL